MSSEDFRTYLIDPDSPRILGARGKDAFDYAKPILERPDARDLISSWGALYNQPFSGITSDGAIQPGLFQLQHEGFDAAPAVSAANILLSKLTLDEREHIQYPLTAREWRSWYNPEFPINRCGIRLDYVSPVVRAAFTNLMRACLGAEGYLKTERTRLANLYLGEIYDLQNIMNEWSFHALLYGTPSTTEPWGWSIYGHHLAIHCLMLGGQIVISPTFMGVEPSIVNLASGASFRIFEAEETAGLRLIRSLSPAERECATTYKNMKDDAMPKGRWHFADERHLGAAFQDNRTIPYEGICVGALTAAQQDQALTIIEAFINYLPDAPRKARMTKIAAKLDETWFSWIGTYGDNDPFYYRIQSPIIMVEFDHHAGVWLTNAHPAKFHIHTVVRTPNGNDYGKDLLRQHYEQADPQKLPPDETDRDPLALFVGAGKTTEFNGVRAEHQNEALSQCATYERN